MEDENAEKLVARQRAADINSACIAEMLRLSRLLADKATSSAAVEIAKNEAEQTIAALRQELLVARQEAELAERRASEAYSLATKAHAELSFAKSAFFNEATSKK